MDGWRVVTGLLAALFLCGSVFLFSAASDARQEAEECVRTDGWFCWDLTVPFLIGGTWLFLLAGCFGGATVAPAGSSRRKFVVAGLCLLLPVFLLLLASPITFAIVVAGVAVFLFARHRVISRRSTDGPAKGWRSR